jgi:CRP-like cAMP-binding protein
VLQTLPERLATWLLHQSGSQPGWISGLSYQMVADELGTYRETVAAILRAFMRRGFVKIDYGRIHIVDVDGLADLADSPHW